MAEFIDGLPDGKPVNPTVVGSEPGAVSGHDVGRMLIHVVQMAAGTGLTVLAENLGHLNLGPWQPVAAIALTAAIDLLRRWASDTKVAPVGPKP
jgi:hypothetical protein